MKNWQPLIVRRYVASFPGSRPAILNKEDAVRFWGLSFATGGLWIWAGQKPSREEGGREGSVRAWQQCQARVSFFLGGGYLAQVLRGNGWGGGLFVCLFG